MSGQKDGRVEAIDADRMREAVLREAERARLRQQTAEACAIAQREIEAAASRLHAIERERTNAVGRHEQVREDLERVSVERVRVERRIEQMRRETIQTRERAAELSRDIAADQRRLTNDLQALMAQERQLLEQQRSLESRIAAYDGGELLAASTAVQEAEARQERLNADLARLEAEIAAYEAAPALGFVIEQMVSSFSEFDFHVQRAYVSNREIEIVMQRHGEETVRIATPLIGAKLDKAKLDPRISLLLERSEPSLDACIADTMKIMQRLREKGVALTFELREPPPSGGGRRDIPEHLPESDRDRTR
jgi:hypothetical protein